MRIDVESAFDFYDRAEELNRVGIALSREKDINRLLEIVLLAAKRITQADAGTLYRIEDAHLRFEIMRTDSLGIALGGTTGRPIQLDPIPLFNEKGQPNEAMVVAYAALRESTVNIADAYAVQGFDFSGTRSFDAKTGYRSQSFLTVPMKNHEDEVIGVLQLINARDARTGEIIAFSEADQRLAESLASQAAIVLTTRLLITQLEQLFESFINLINAAIDDKSPYTGRHCERVPALTMMLAEAAHASSDGALREFIMTDTDRYELKIAGLLHDCGKITTPVHVVDKATKLETIFDRIQLIDTRFEVLKRDTQIAMLRGQIEAMERGDTGEVARLSSQCQQVLADLSEEQTFLRHSNIGSEVMSVEDQERVRSIGAHRKWRNERGEHTNVLSDEEMINLTIRSGTLTATERQIINHHIEVTIQMLESLPWPRHLRNVPEYAGGHHERMDGKGYPRGLTREQMSIPARIIGIADIFEALTAADRPYKKGKKLTEALAILGKLKVNNHIDPDLFDVFIREKVWLKFAHEFLDDEQIDEVDLSRIPGFRN
ncbi:MAG: GAF domain-containing protein [Betaproteobacteria bacterium]|nr:GAF domain-containing protein [Betaproteobacteria bacterium]